MKVLVVGAGGREHALIWCLSRSPRVSQLVCAPGNGGTCALAENLPLAADDVDGLVEAVSTLGIELVVIGPEAPLVAGLADRLRARDVPVVGPGRAAAALEGSKAFAKHIMDEAGVPTGRFQIFDDAAAAVRYVEEQGAPIVIKADGLAAGKGVVVASSLEEATEAIESCLLKQRFGAAGAKVLIEEFLEGAEASLIALTDGKTVLPLATSKDHKRLLTGDGGPNTGGMGAISPSPDLDDAEIPALVESLIVPVVKTLAARGIPYSGFIYAGLMLTPAGPKVLEFNCRLGDPETQPLLFRLDSDLLPVLLATALGELEGQRLIWKPGAASCVVLASGGYPGPYDKGFPIEGLDVAAGQTQAMVFHAGTAKAPDGAIVTNGGRVLGVTARGTSLAEATERAYRSADLIRWRGLQRREDIGGRRD